MPKRLRVILSIGLTIATLALFGFYLRTHESLLARLGLVSPLTVLWIVLLYVAWFGSLAFILWASLRLYRRRIPLDENLLLGAYASLVNYLLPGQGGPAVRGAYLKRRHGFALRHYIVMTLCYYAIYAVVSAFLLLGGAASWWMTLLGVGGATLIGAAVVYWYVRRTKKRVELALNYSALLWLSIATIVQSILQLLIYGLELHSVDAHLSIGQIMSYTGAADFSLFVALTPGAIGIREAFLLFSRRLHHVSASTILSAAVLDRGSYLIFLAIVFALTIIFHARGVLGLSRPKSSPSNHKP